MHIFPKGFTRIRHYGILSSSWKKEKLAQLQATMSTKELTAVLPKEPLLHLNVAAVKRAPYALFWSLMPAAHLKAGNNY